MTVPLYQTDSYLREFSAVVTAVDEAAHAVLLDQSAFYPGGGGQPCDQGWLRMGAEKLTVEKMKKGPEGACTSSAQIVPCPWWEPPCAASWIGNAATP
mgnify:CR=1 FL=1